MWQPYKIFWNLVLVSTFLTASLGHKINNGKLEKHNNNNLDSPYRYNWKDYTQKALSGDVKGSLNKVTSNILNMFCPSMYQVILTYLHEKVKSDSTENHDDFSLLNEKAVQKEDHAQNRIEVIRSIHRNTIPIQKIVPEAVQRRMLHLLGFAKPLKADRSKNRKPKVFKLHSPVYKTLKTNREKKYKYIKKHPFDPKG